MNWMELRPGSRQASGRHGDVAIRILSCDFPRWHFGGGAKLAFLLLAGILMAAPAQAGRAVTAQARVLSGAAEPGPERARELLDEKSQGTPAAGEFEQIPAISEVEIYRDGAWIRLSSVRNAGSGAERQICVVYLGN